MIRLVSGDAGVIFQLQHLLNHGHGIRRTFSLVILVPDSKTILGLARLARIEDVPLTVFRISKVGHGDYSRTKTMARANEAKMVPDTFFTLRKMPLDRIVDLSRAYLISYDTDPNRQTGSGIRDGFQVDPYVLPVSKL